MSDDAKPLPVPDPLTKPYWAAAKEDQLLLPRCRLCRAWHFYPRSVCPQCGSDDLEWQPASGTGSVYSFTVVHRPPAPAFADEVPYTVAMIGLDEGPHLMTRIVGCVPDQVRVGMRVRVQFEPASDEMALPVFSPEPNP